MDIWGGGQDNLCSQTAREKDTAKSERSRNMDMTKTAAGRIMTASTDKERGSVLADDLVCYCLRHTFCTDLQKKGVPVDIAKYLMGHADIRTTANIYAHSRR